MSSDRCTMGIHSRFPEGFSSRKSTLERWADSPSLSASRRMSGASAARPSRDSAIRLDRLRKSLAESPEAHRAVPPVGSTCDGPAA